MEKMKEELNIYYCGREQCAPDHFWGPAIRPHYLLHVILKGTGKFSCRRQTWQLGAGDAFLIHPQESHYYQADHEDPWEYVWVGFDGRAAESLLEQTALKDALVYRRSPSDPENPDCRQALLDLNEAFQGTDRNVLELTARLLLVFSRMPAVPAPSGFSREEQYYRTAVEYIRNNYSYDVKIQDIAGFVGIDRTYLYKIFMQAAGVSPKQYLLTYRVRCASTLLQTQRYTITETAYSCGFRDAAAFCTTFRQHMGMTPMQYKKRTARWLQEEESSRANSHSSQ